MKNTNSPISTATPAPISDVALAVGGDAPPRPNGKSWIAVVCV